MSRIVDVWMQHPDRALADRSALGLDDEARELGLGGDAQRVFALA